MRLVGPPAAKKLISVVNSVIAAPGQDKVKNKIGDELLLGLAATASPDAVKYVLDNYRHHTREHLPARWDDPLSSAQFLDRQPGEDAPVVRPRTWLLRVGWRERYPLVGLHEVPGGAE